MNILITKRFQKRTMDREEMEAPVRVTTHIVDRGTGDT
jgi:hypothetical protein